MRIYIERNYGADADGNRGHRVEEAFLDESDYDDVVDKLYDNFINDFSLHSTFEVVIDGYIFDVKIYDYLSGLYDKAMSDPKVLDDYELMEWLETEIKPLIRK